MREYSWGTVEAGLGGPGLPKRTEQWETEKDKKTYKERVRYALNVKGYKRNSSRLLFSKS